MKCDCEKWKTNTEKMKAIFISAHIHGVNYTGDEYEYCPWCGKQLTPENFMLWENDKNSL